MSRHVLPAFSVLGLLAAIVTATRVSSAHASHRSAFAETERLVVDAGLVHRLRDTRARARLVEPPDDDVLRSVTNALDESGLSSRAFSGLATDGDEALRGRTGYRRKTYRLDLSDLDTTDLGSFLDTWMTNEPLWAVEAIELRRESASRRAHGPPTAYSVTLTVSTVYTETDRRTGAPRP
jgi:hypothetical protein